MPDRLLTELEKPAVANERSEDFQLLDVLLILSKNRRLIAKYTLAALLLALVAAFVLPVKYTAAVRILPPNQSNNAAGLLGAISGAGGSAGSLLSGALNIKNPSDVYVAMLKSRTLRDKLIDRFQLKDLYGKKTYVDTRSKLDWNTDITVGKEGVITLEFEDGDPRRARAIAEGYLEELMLLSENIAAGEGGQRRRFYERELERQKNKLADAEVELKKVQQSTGLIVPSEQARAIIESIARLRGAITAKEVQLGAMRSFATEQNPEYQQAQRELAAMREQLAKLERAQTNQGEPNMFVPSGRVPESALEFIRKYRDFKYHETLYELLAKQYELARLDEARDYAPLQVLDHATEPDKRSKPFRALIVALGTFAGLVLGCWVALVGDARRQRAESPEYREKWDRIKRYWRKGSRA